MGALTLAEIDEFEGARVRPAARLGRCGDGYHYCATGTVERTKGLVNDFVTVRS